MKHQGPELSPTSGPERVSEEDALIEEIQQLRAALRIYRELVERLLSERKNGD